MTCSQLGGREWLADVLVAAGELETVCTDTNRVPGENFIVMRCSSAERTGFSHSAVSVEKLEESSQQIEERIARILRSITNGVIK